MDPAAWGVVLDYHDVRGELRRAPEGTVAALLESMGAREAEPPPPPVRVMRHGERVPLETPAELLTEDGEQIRVEQADPIDIPLGYHRLIRPDSGSFTRLIVVPRTCFLPDDLHAWGWAVQLYALRSASSWGIGDLGNLRRLNQWAKSLGAGFTLINPLHSVDPFPQQDSPYFPGSRCWRNPLYIEIEKVPGAPLVEAELERSAGPARLLNDDRIIRRPEVHRHKRSALEILWRNFSGDEDFERYKTARGELLDRFATFVALSEFHGDDWRSWPAGLRHPDRAGVARASRDLSERVDFFKWQQWILDRQLREASEALGTVQDLAVGVNPCGFDAWMWQEVFVPRVSVGAPPDDFNLEGQDWGVMAFDPHRLRAAGYEPFIQTLRASFGHAAGLRLDHVMGLWRLFWIPEGTAPSEGTYVRYPAEDLLGILALESHRAGAFTVGEDLGNVEPEVRERLALAAVLSYRLLYFENSAPDAYPPQSLAAVTNHDLPTLCGLWNGSDLAAQAAAGVEPNVDFARAAKTRICDLTGLSPTARANDVIEAVYEALARAPSRLLAATVEDALRIEERSNQPGTLDEHPNWSRALPSLEAIAADPGPRRIASLLGRRR